MKALLVANWKMHPAAPSDARELLSVTKKTLLRARNVFVVITPPALFLADLVGRTKSKTIGFGVQNVHWEKEGAFTGEISPLQAKETGAGYVIVGHAERRQMGERNEDVGRKVAAVIATGGLKAIVCIGERTRDESGAFLRELAEQLKIAIGTLTAEQLSRIIIAYEPVWAIGASEPMSSHEMHEISIYIRKLLLQRFGESAMRVAILYGGAVTAETAPRMLQDGEVQGLLVGRVSVGKTQWANLITAVHAA